MRASLEGCGAQAQMDGVAAIRYSTCGGAQAGAIMRDTELVRQFQSAKPCDLLWWPAGCLRMPEPEMIFHPASLVSAAKGRWPASGMAKVRGSGGAWTLDAKLRID
eukprot:scaffold11342_cov114-Isochrysis_galbana.AAC.5